MPLTLLHPHWLPHPHPQYRHLVVKSSTTAGQHDMSSAWGSGWCFGRCTPTHSPLNAPGTGIWWPRVVLPWVPLTWAHVLLSAMNCLEFSRVVCNRLSSFFICNPSVPPDTLVSPPAPVEASSGQEWYYCRSAWHVISLGVRLMFCQMYPHPSPLNAPGRGIWWPRVVLTWVSLTWAHVLLSEIDHLQFSRILCNRPSSFFIWNPQCPCQPLDTPPPVQASSGQEWYYCRSAWHVISLGVRLMFCQMYSHSIIPYAPQCPQVEASGDQEWY